VLLRCRLPRPPPPGGRHRRADPLPDGPSRLLQRGLTPMSPANARISAEELFEQQRERLQLRWFAGQAGRGRVLEAVETVARRPSLAGYLNAIYPNKVQILGSEELAWLDALDSRHRWETIEKIIQFRPLALVISKAQ